MLMWDATKIGEMRDQRSRRRYERWQMKAIEDWYLHLPERHGQAAEHQLRRATSEREWKRVREPSRCWQEGRFPTCNDASQPASRHRQKTETYY